MMEEFKRAVHQRNDEIVESQSDHWCEFLISEQEVLMIADEFGIDHFTASTYYDDCCQDI
jgi:hypothetical protein